MGLAIAATAAAPQPRDEGATDGAARVADACIRRAGLDRSAIDVLVNLGVYPDGNRVEPAAAPFIQKALAINVDPLRDGFDRTTFSFDLNSGPHCFLMAAQAVDALARTGAVRHALLVSSNAAGVRAAAHAGPRPRLATAAILRADGRDSAGFADFAFYVDDEAALEASGYCDPAEFGPGAGGHAVAMPAADSPAADRFMLTRTQDYLGRAGVDRARISLVLSSHRSPALDRGLAEATGASLSPPPEATDLPGAVLGSTLMAAWDAAHEAGLLRPGETILLIEGGSGASAAFAIYRC